MQTTGVEAGDRLRLDTPRLVLRALQAADAAALRDLAGDWEVARHTARIPHPYGAADAEAFIAATRRCRAEGGEQVFAIERRVDGVLLGCIGIELSGAPPAGSLGFWLGRPFWGQGYATEALDALVDHAFRQFGAERLQISALPANGRSIRVQEKAGFMLVGRGREPAPARGTDFEVEIRALTRAEHERRRLARPLPVVLVSAVALIDADGRLLLARRPAGKAMAGLWEFPGGKVHDGETPEAALIRELCEELGIDVAESCLAPFSFASHRYADFHLLMPLYVCRVWQGIVAPQEHQEIAWVRPARLADYEMPPADKPLVAMLRDLL